MRFSLILEDESGNQMDMTTTKTQYMVSTIDGLYPPAGTLSTSAYAVLNGSYLNHAFIEKRNLVISFVMRGTVLEKKRHALYNVVKPSQYIKVYYKTKNVDVYTEGYVETCNVSNFTNQTSGQISILCPDPYWYSRELFSVQYGSVSGAFHFPFPDSTKPFPIGSYSEDSNIAILNSGIETGFTIVLETESGTQSMPTIYHDDTDTYLQLNTTIESGEQIIITTYDGNKTITKYTDGVESNIISSIVSGSTWLKLRSGLNHLHLQTAGASSNPKLNMTILYRIAYLVV